MQVWPVLPRQAKVVWLGVLLAGALALSGRLLSDQQRPSGPEAPLWLTLFAALRARATLFWTAAVRRTRHLVRIEALQLPGELGSALDERQTSSRNCASAAARRERRRLVRPP